MTEWIECTLDKLGEIVGGATPSTKCEDYYGGSIPWITPKDLSSFKGRYITSGERNITEKGLASCSAQMMPKDAVLFTSRAPIGYVAIASQSVCTNQGFKSIVVNEKADPLFVYYLLKYNKDAIEAMGSGTTFKEVSGKTMRAVKVRIPLDVSYQNRIAAVLDSLDTKIENNERINDNLHQQAATLFKALFVDLTPFDGTMPPNWTISTLGDATEMGAGGDKPKESSPVKTPLCPYPIYSNGINDYGLYGYTNDPKIKVESVTVSARGTIGYVCLRHTPYVPIVRLVTLIPDTKVLSAKYLYLYLRQLHITGTGTTQQQLTVPDSAKLRSSFLTKTQWTLLRKLSLHFLSKSGQTKTRIPNLPKCVTRYCRNSCPARLMFLTSSSKPLNYRLR